MFSASLPAVDSQIVDIHVLVSVFVFFYLTRPHVKAAFT
jgi:hypothetical protein